MARIASTGRVVWIVVIAAVALYLAYMLRRELLIIYAAVMFAVIFMPLVRNVQKWHLGKWHPGRGASILILLAIVFGAIAIALLFAIPKISADAADLLQNSSSITDQLRNKISRMPFGAAIASRIHGNTLQQTLTRVMSPAFSVFRSASQGIVGLATIAILTAYFMLEAQTVLRWSLSLFPAEQQPRLHATLVQAARRVQTWLKAQAIMMVILSSASAITFGALGIHYFYALAAFAGIANFVPILGPIATVVIAGLVAVTQSWTKLVGVLIFYAVYQQVESSYITPKVMRESVGLPSSAVLVALAVGAGLAGVIGAILAVPSAAWIATFIHEYVSKPHGLAYQQTGPTLPEREQRAA